MCGDGRARVGECGMVWFWLLGLSASVLAGREAGLPQQVLGPGDPSACSGKIPKK